MAGRIIIIMRSVRQESDIQYLLVGDEDDMRGGVHYLVGYA